MSGEQHIHEIGIRRRTHVRPVQMSLRLHEAKPPKNLGSRDTAYLGMALCAFLLFRANVLLKCAILTNRSRPPRSNWAGDGAPGAGWGLANFRRKLHALAVLSAGALMGGLVVAFRHCKPRRHFRV
jgi:hypothetical protein